MCVVFSADIWTMQTIHGRPSIPHTNPSQFVNGGGGGGGAGIPSHPMNISLFPTYHHRISNSQNNTWFLYLSSFILWLPFLLLFYSAHKASTAKKIRFMYSQNWNCPASFPHFHIHVSVNDLYISRIGVHLFYCNKAGRPILEIYKSLTDTWM